MSAPLSPALDSIIRQLGGPASVEYRHLNTVISSSPVLAAQLEQAVTNGEVKHFAYLPAETNAGAQYDPRSQTVQLNRAHIRDTDFHNDLAFIIGHETRHGTNRHQVAQSYTRFNTEARAVLQSGLQEHNYTDVIARSMQTLRQDEASAHIAGWNALVSRVRTEKPNATLKDVYSRSGYAQNHFIDRQGNRYTMKPGFTLQGDLSLDITSARNIEAAGKHYFDRTPLQSRLGHHGNSDYRNYYAAWHVGTLCQYEALNPAQAGKMTLDMQSLKLSERLLEQNGINLGGEGRRCSYYTPQAIHTERHFDHTATTHTYRPILAEPLAAEALDQSLPQNGKPERTLTPEVTPDKALTERQQQWADAIEKFAGDKLRAMGLSETQIENVTAAGIKDMQLRFADKDIQFVGINPDKGGILVIGTGPNFDFPNVSINEAKDKPAQDTLQEMEREQQRQQNRGGPDEPEKGGPGR